MEPGQPERTWMHPFQCEKKRSTRISLIMRSDFEVRLMSDCSQREMYLPLARMGKHAGMSARARGP